MAAEDDEWKKLALEDRCVHKQWKARVNGYEEVKKLFQQIDDEKSPEFSKYLGLIKKFVSDSNAAGQEKGLEATLAFVENYAHAGKTAGEVMSGIVTKCIAAPKTRTRELALQITLMYVEIEKHEIVVEELIKGMEQKNPKIITACLSAITTALHEFGSKVINVKPLIKKISTLFADRDKGVRDEARAMVVEIFRWIGPALKSQLNSLQPVQVTELEAEFEKIAGQKAVPTRYLRSQQQKQAKIAETAIAEDVEEEDDEADGETPQIDAYELAEPVDVISKLPKNFYEQIEAKKWQERKETLEALEKLVNAPRLENGDYGDIVRALKKVIQKDSNVVVTALAGRCMALLASGLKKRFQVYASACVPTLLEKFKEKKQNVVTAIRDAIDAVYQATTLEAILEDVVEALNNKNPSVKSETAMFLSRAFTKTLSTALNKKLLKAYCGALIKNINEPDPTVRDCSSEALGTLMKLVGERGVAPFIAELEKDNLKMSKVKECCEKAVIVVKTPGVKKERPNTAPNKAAAASGAVLQKTASAPAPKTTKRPGTAAKKKPGSVTSGTATIVKSKSNKNIVEKLRERELSDDEAIEIVGNLINIDLLPGLMDVNWKTRLGSMEDFTNQIRTLDLPTAPTQALIKIITRKPGLKDTNFQVLKARLDAVKYIAENCVFSTTTADLCINDITDKFGDAKNGAAAGDALVAIAEATKLEYVAAQVLDFAFTQKSPKVLQEALLWLSNAIKEFGFDNLNTKVLIENSKKALASTNPAVRTAGITLLGTMYLYMGQGLNIFFENEKPALRDQITAECQKYTNEKPPIPSRGIQRAASQDNLDEIEDEEGGAGDSNTANAPDLLPRVDISSHITESFINELSDKNWKVRNETLIKLSTVLSDAKLIKANIADLPQALALRLVDSNSKIAQMTLNICEVIATAMGPPCKQHVRALLPGFLQGLGDSKAWIRSASVSCMNTWGEQCGYKEFFESEMIGDALKTGSPTLRSELWLWLSEKLPKIKSVPKEELMVCLPHLYTNLEDRNADVRKNAQEAVLGIMIHLSYESMVKQTDKLKPGSKSVVMAALDKARPSLPAKPLPKIKQAVASEKEDKTVRGTKPVANSKNAIKTKGGAAAAKQVTNRKKEDDVDTSPLLVINNMKHQRTIDESKLRVLKWNFTTPREEFVELLKEQMGAANVNKTLTANMFHADFRYHIKAIDLLVEDLPDNGPALISNLDLILKWITLRFFDTNPSVLLRALEYLHSVFNMLIETRYHLLESEASAFIPYLVLKAGDPKDAVRNGVRSIFKQICNIYAVSKLFSYVMEGLKSKNARQRTECLDLMGSIIEDNGITVCLPSPAACLKEVAKQISDRDNAVRNAALNCVVQAYFLVDEKVFKMVGQISDKDMSLLEERIKRAKRPMPKIAKMEAPPMNLHNNGSPNRNNINPSPPYGDDANGFNNEEDDDEVEDDDIPGVTLPSQVAQENTAVTGPFKLDPDVMKHLDSQKSAVPKIQLQEFDLDFLKEDIVVPSLSDARAKVMPLSPPKPILPNQTFSRSSLGHLQSASRVPKDLVLERTITNIGAQDLITALQAIEQMQEILQSNKGNLMIDYEDQFMIAITTQLKHLHPQDPRLNPTVSRLYRALLTIVDAFYAKRCLGTKVSIDVLKDIMNELILLLVEAKLENCPSGDAYIRVVNLHCVKIIERSDHTNIVCALVRLLHDSIRSGGSPRLTDLVMKCLWRVIKIMPSWADEIDYDSVLLEVHIFLKAFPSVWWKTKQVDTPLRTVKTILHSMAKVKGGELMLHLGKIPNVNDSELESYILRLLKSLKVEEAKQVPLKTEKTEPRRSLSRSVHTMLTDIFQKIGNKTETKEGLNLLYDFLQQHPEADIDPFLQRSSKFFQDYINTGLKDIEETRSGRCEVIGKTASPATGAVVSGGEAGGKGPEYWQNRLKMWNKLWDDSQHKAGQHD